MSFEKLYSIARFFCLLGLMLALLSFTVSGENKAYFSVLFLYFPILWFVWIGFAVSGYLNKKIWNLLTIWVIIDLAILATFVSFAIDVDNWAHSGGIDIVLSVTYFPIAGPMLGLIHSLPKGTKDVVLAAVKLRSEILGPGVGAAVGLWFSMSILSIIQSALILSITHFVRTVLRRLSNNTTP